MKKLRYKKLSSLLATQKKSAQSYYCEVEYLESDGYQYIDTGIYFDCNYDMQYKVKAMSLSTSRSIIMSSYAGAAHSSFGLEFGGSTNSGAIRVYYNTTGSAVSQYTSSLSVNVGRIIDCKYDSTENKIYFSYDGGTAITYNTSKGNLPNTYPIRLFLDARTTSVASIRNPERIYYCQIFKNGILVRDLIPVLDLNYVPCMYDRVSGQLFYNQGTGNFIAGREIHQTEYIESNGTQYINTGLVGRTGYTVETELAFTALSTGSYQYFAGYAYNGAADRIYFIGVRNTANKLGYTYGNDTANVAIAEITTNTFYKIKSIMAANSQKMYLNNVEIGSSTNGDLNYDLSNPNYIYMFVSQYPNTVGVNGYCNVRVKNAKWYFNNTLVRDYIAAVDENGIGFMFDKVTHTIFDNVGIGKFNYAAVEIEYIKSDGYSWIDTGIAASSTVAVEVKASSDVAQKAILGACTTASVTNNRYQMITSNSTRFSARIDGGTTTADVSTIQDVFILLLDAYNKIFKVNNSAKALNYNGSITTNNIYLFARSYSDDTDVSTIASTTTMYYCKMWDEETLTRDYVPVYHNGVACFKEKLSNTYTTNLGTGSFTAGKIIS